MTSFEGRRRKEISSWRFHLGYFLKEERKSRQGTSLSVVSKHGQMIRREREELCLNLPGSSNPVMALSGSDGLVS